MRTIKQILIITLVVMMAANIATIIYQGTTDTTDPPVINCPGGILEVSASVSEADLLADVTASDGQDGDLTPHLLVAGISKLISEDTAKVTYLVFDSDDNMASYVRKIRYTDYRKPRFTVKEPLIYSNGEEVDLLSNLGANDVIDGDISEKVRVSTLASTENPEIYDITIQVTNSRGDTASLQLPVLRLAYNPMRANVVLTDYLVYTEVGADFDPMVYLEAVEDFSGSPNLENVQVKSWVNTSAAGVYRVYYTYTDSQGTGTAILTVAVL